MRKGRPLRAGAALLAIAWAGACVTPAVADVPRAKIEGVEEQDLRRLLERAVETSPEAPASRFEARRRARAAAERVVAALRSEGYYGSAVEPDVADGEPLTPIVRVTLGVRFTFTETTIAWQGAPPDERVRATALSATGLAQGAPGRSEDIVEAEGRALAVLAARGHPDARADPRRVVVDHAASSVQPTYNLAAGPLVRLDGLALEPGGRTRPEWIQGLKSWQDGDTYSPDAVAELERRLLDTGVYDSVTVALAPPAQTNAQGLRPIIVSLADRPARTIELGAGFSTSEGPGVEAEFARYNRLGRGDTLTVRTVLASIERRLAAELALPHYGRAGRTFRVGAEAFSDQTDAFDETGIGVRADMEQRYGRYTFFTYGARFDVSQTVELGQDRNFAALTGLAAFALDRSNELLDPTSGFRVDGRLEPTALTGDTSLAFLRVVAQASTYVPLDEEQTNVIAVRARLGSIVGGMIPDVPAGRRFYAGGGGSVRGYEFQGIGPRIADGTPSGGLSLAEGSLEFRRRSFGDRGIRRVLGAVAFIDAGSVNEEQYPDIGEIQLAVGVGLRFDLGFAPVRADFAIPLDKRNADDAGFQIYLSLGQAF